MGLAHFIQCYILEILPTWINVDMFNSMYTLGSTLSYDHLFVSPITDHPLGYVGLSLLQVMLQ